MTHHITRLAMARFAPAVLFGLAIPTIQTPSTPTVTVTSFNPGAIYRAGETVGWSITAPDGYTVPTTYAIRLNNHEVVASGTVDFRTNPVRISFSPKIPAMVNLELRPAGAPPMLYGAAYEPLKLRPVVARPRDFDAFWSRKLRELRSIGAYPELTARESKLATVDYGTIRMENINRTHVYGQWAKPKRSGKFPALVILQWASPPYPLDPNWILGRANDGFLVLNIEPHDVLPTEPPAYYQALPDRLKNYAATGWDNREESSFVEMYCRGVRAVDYIKTRPDWDGKTIAVMGGSMGGQQALAVAGLHPSVTHVLAEEPAGCDLNASLHGRQMGYPFFPADNPKVMETARYVDAINFAPRIRAKALVGMGFVDTVTPPAGIWTAFNLIRGPKEVAPMPEAPHNNLATQEQLHPFRSRAEAWLKDILEGSRPEGSRR